MKITNVKVELFNWEREAWITGVGTTFGGTKKLGVVSVETDEGITGNAFLGSPLVGADHFAPALIEFAKPMLIGRNPQFIGCWVLVKSKFLFIQALLIMRLKRNMLKRRLNLKKWVGLLIKYTHMVCLQLI